ncbi:hypothetical protein [Wolbachia endosymbiont (group A) of Udea olivalis]
MLNTSSSKVRRESLKKSSLESKVSSQQSTEEMGSEDSDRCEPNSIEGKHWYELLKEKIGFDINAKKWMEEHPELASKNKSELLIRLAYELCLAKNTKYDPENENEEQNNKYIRFDTQRIFALFEVANELIDPSDRKNFVEFVCQKGNVQLLEMICKQESSKDFNKIKRQYKWQGAFTGYSKLIDLLQYVIDNRCSQEIVLCIAKKVYGYSHIFYNGEQYLEPSAVVAMKSIFNYQDSVVKELLKQAIKLGYKDTVSVMLSGDIYHSIRLMKWQKFQEEPEFIAAYNMIKETVADVIDSWVEGCKDDLRRLLDQGIEIDINEIGKEDLIYQLEYLGEEVKRETTRRKERLVQELKKLGKEKGEVRLKSTIVGALISTLFFNYQDKVMEGGLFILKIKQQDDSKKGKILDTLKKKISKEESIDSIMLELIKLLHLGNHIKSNWFFREVLVEVVNKNLDKLKAVCAAICKEPMEELLRGEEVHEDVIDVLQFFGVDTHSLKRDLGSVESQETFEYTDSSSATETNKLSSQDIVDVAKYYYKWMEPINGKYLEGMNEKVFFTCTDRFSLEDKLKHYKKIQQKDLIFTSIINTGRKHWVTLVVARNVLGKNVAYYCDSFCKKKIPSVLKKALKIDIDCIGTSQIKQHEDEYDCGIFALANAYKITGMIKGKSFTEINIELKGKFDIGQLRKDFAKKVKEMRQKSGVDSEEEVHEPMEVKDGVDSLFLPDLKAAERKNEEIVKNDCRQDKNIQYPRGVLSVIAHRVGVFHERKVMIGSSSVKRKRNWSEVEDIASRRKRGRTRVIKFTPPTYLEFLTMFEEEYKDLLLEYEFSYDNLKLLCAPCNKEVVGYDEFSSPSSGEFSSPTRDEESEETAFEIYDRAITLLTNGNKKEAISKLNDLSEKHEMPHARYALAVVKFKDLWKGEAAEFGKDKKSDLVVSEIIKSLNRMTLDNDLRPLNTSLLLKVQKYDIGGYGNQVREITGLTVDDLLYKIVSCTKDTVFRFRRELVPESALLQPGQIISKDTDRRDYAEFLIRFSMYEFLKLKMLKKDDLRGEDVAIIDAFSQISKCKFIKTFNSFPAWVMYGHAIYLLESNIGEDNGKRDAVELLNKACKLKHQGALYLRGALLCDRKNFQFISEDPIQFQECFNGLESFAKRYKNETAACMVANEHLRSDSLVRQMSQGDAEKKAKEILENSGCIYIWKDWEDKQECNGQLLSSTPVRTGALRESKLSLSFTTSTASQAHSSSSPLSFTSFQQVEHSPMSPMSYFNSSFAQGLFLGSRERSESVSRFGQL